MDQKIIKIYEGVDLQVDEGRREVISIINTDAIDRDSEVVQPKGMKRKEFQGNPVVFVNHDYSTLPVGTSRWIKAGTDAKGSDVLIAKTFISDKTEFARDVFGLMQDGVLRAFSIGFQSNRSSKPTTAEINARPELKAAKLIHRDWSLLEYSVVGIPANPDALTLAVSKGYSQQTLDLISGKVANTMKAAEEVAATVAAEPALNKNAISQKELQKLIAKRIEEITVAIDPDRVIATVMRRLSA